MTDIICPLCGKANPPERDECQYCQAPLKITGFLPPEPKDNAEQSLPPAEASEPEERQTSSLEQAVPDWLRQTEASFLESSESETEEPTFDQLSEQIDSLLHQPPTASGESAPALDDDWLTSLLEEAGLSDSSTTPPQERLEEEQAEATDVDEADSMLEEPEEEQPAVPLEPAEKPKWLSELEASSKIKLEGVAPPAESGETGEVSKPREKEIPREREIPEWVGKPSPEEKQPEEEELEAPIAPAELPGWLEAMRPKDEEETVATRPVEDLSAAEIVTAGPLVGLRGVISAHPSAIRARKPPTYSIKLRVTDDQQARVEMMNELLANEQKPKPLPSKPIITSRNVSRLVIAVFLILPIVWMIVSGSEQVPAPQPGNIPGVIEFIQQVQALPQSTPVLMAFDYEAGFSGEMNLAIDTVLSQLMAKNAYLTLVSTNTSGPALAESLISTAVSGAGGEAGYSNYADLGYLPGGTMGLFGFATSPMTILPYSLDGKDVWQTVPLSRITTIKDFSTVIVMTNDPGVARSWIEQAGPVLQESGTPLLIVTSAQAEPLLRPYYEATPSQVQGLIAGVAGGLSYSKIVGNTQPSGVWDAFSIGVSASALLILVGAIIGGMGMIRTAGTKKEG